ncbi:MAG: Penicillin-binding protein, 1A family [Candidatus Yanofskybacteria bacterium GW2011_GWA1_39_13]|uniref:Penicillin-binding protein, 1A family n=1 Tax=Yanofskybacteria sp. (strain GW2011_GWA1_39_13) TaxID=1619019 RepID=A0A0G0MHI3_YANXG|nr:MAG: Penicillin-binding protein, 1A family [Candidatus Yanofskybacteria bacterium GW2011_GWA1_39_13]
MTNLLRKFRKIGTFKNFKALAMLFLWLFVIGTIMLLSFFLYLQRTLPDPESIATRKVGESTKIYDNTGEILLYDIHGEEKRTIIPWEQIPENIKKATLASEDSDFYNHKGLDLKGIARAFFKDIINLGVSQGGSTITQQLVKKALLGDERTISRKIKEAVLAIEIERKFTKDQIFWMYLNQIPYGSNAYGIEAAAKEFFGKNAYGLTLAEAATLASLPKAPSFYSPFGNHVDALMGVKNSVLASMKNLGYINETEYQEALSQKLEFKAVDDDIQAPHFVIMVKEYMSSKYGEDAVESGGFKIITTLDSNLQKIAEEAVSKYATINKEKYKAVNASLVAINPRNGDLLALVGSKDYFNIEDEGNFNVAIANRQPGSSFKPFAYAAALAKGYPDDTVVFDLKTEFNPNCNPNSSQTKDQYGLDCYHPQNYDGRYRGPVTFRQGLSQSLNVPSVKALYLAGIDDTITLAENMGITTLGDKSRFGLSLVLGGAEVKLVDLVSAYGVFANDGMRSPWSFIQKIESSNGQVLEEKTNEQERVIDSQIARLISNMLSDNVARAPVFGYSSSLYFPGRDVAAKTGTTQENRDAWVVGYSPNLVAGVWTGNNKNESMTKEGAGISASGPMWHEFMAKALSTMPNERFTNPDPVIVNKVMLDGNYTYLREGSSFPEYHEVLYYVDRSNPLGPIPLNPSTDPQFKNWEWPVTNFYNPPIQ